MTYQEAVDWHEETKQYGSILGLENIRVLMHELQDVWRQLKIVHIAGTNGKGSVCCFLASVLKEAGYRVGQFNSPAVFDLREVYQINGEWISREAYADGMQKVRDACRRMTDRGLSHPTVFEIETALAFIWFRQENCDLVLLETGMGGSTDATNLIEKPLCSVLVSISMDHMDFLGNTLEDIAKVKSGIIKEHCPVISVKQPEAVEKVFRSAARDRQAAYIEACEITESRSNPEGFLCYHHPAQGEVELSMTGSYQVKNSSLAIEVLQFLQRQGYEITREQICRGLKQAVCGGRFECLAKEPLFYIDGAHNADAAYKLKETLINNFPNTKKIGIMGVMADKEYEKMLDHLQGMFAEIYTVTPKNPRSLSAEKLAEVICDRGIRGIVEESVRQAVWDACRRAKEESGDVMVTAFGSLYYLSEVKRAFYEITGDNQ